MIFEIELHELHCPPLHNTRKFLIRSVKFRAGYEVRNERLETGPIAIAIG